MDALVEAIPQIVWQISVEGKTKYISSKWEKFSGLKTSETVWGEVMHPDDYPSAKVAWKILLILATPLNLSFGLERRTIVIVGS